jgi:hypothetical protein
MTPIEQAILLRNARLKAWRGDWPRGQGVPVEGGWEAHPTYGILLIRCAACPSSEMLGRWRKFFVFSAKSLEEVESELAGVVRRNCPHLAPLLGEDPPWVAAAIPLAVLELGS